MDVFAHALWAGAGVMLAQRRWAVTSRTATATVSLAVAPDIPHLLPIVGWSVFGTGTAAPVEGYAIAVPGLWIPLLGWWSHIVIDMFTHSADYYPSPVLWPITRQGFDGAAWNTPVFMTLNYLALAAVYLWLIRRRWRSRIGTRS